MWFSSSRCLSEVDWDWSLALHFSNPWPSLKSSLFLPSANWETFCCPATFRKIAKPAGSNSLLKPILCFGCVLCFLCYPFYRLSLVKLRGIRGSRFLWTTSRCSLLLVLWVSLNSRNRLCAKHFCVCNFAISYCSHSTGSVMIWYSLGGKLWLPASCCWDLQKARPVKRSLFLKACGWDRWISWKYVIYNVIKCLTSYSAISCYDMDAEF